LDNLRLTGLLFLAVGLLVFLLPFLATSVNPNVAIGFAGIIITIVGILILGTNAFRKGMKVQESGLVLAVLGWLALASGALVSLTGFFLQNQVTCACPAEGPCACSVPFYNMMFYGGLIVAIVGIVSIVGGAISSRGNSAISQASPQINVPSKSPSARVIAVIGIVLTVLLVFGIFSNWPGVYVTSINEGTQFFRWGAVEHHIPRCKRSIFLEPNSGTGTKFPSLYRR
jgi:hypothetical protein